MKYLLIPDKFKGSLSSLQLIDSLTRGIQRADGDAEIFNAIVSDGGDGFIDSVAQSTRADEVVCKCLDPLSRPIEATYLYDQETKSAYIEMARTAGLVLLETDELNPLKTSTIGTGNQIRDAIDRGAVNIYVGLGGSATNDGGMGLAEAMGYRFLDQAGTPLKPVGGNLNKVKTIKRPENTDYSHCNIYAINDVNNPLFGTEGAAYTYAAQKGADEGVIRILDDGLKHLSDIVQIELGTSFADIPGSGAAGGTAFGLMTFLGAKFISGTDFVFDLVGIPALLENQRPGMIITGEGKIDDQTLRGKLIFGILELGKKHNIPVIAVCGSLQIDRAELQNEGLREVIEVSDPSKSLSYNMENASTLVEDAIYNYLRGE